MTARRLLLPGVVLALFSGCVSQTDPVTPSQGATPEIIPLPDQVVWSEGFFELRPSTRIDAKGSDAARWTAQWLADLLRRTRNLELRVGPVADPGVDPGVDNSPPRPSGGVILLELGTLPGDTAPETYRLEVSPERIVVSANDAAGLFYGAVSLWQLASANANDAAAAASISIPALTIDDAPRFEWRGLMLDSVRHYQSPEFIRQLIDVMALHKLNVLHWHLTDDQAWRLEIKRYPKLTSVGAWRVPAGAAAAADIDPATGKPRAYGGFYTQEEVREIVAYAAARHITIVPEIEMPGHAQAAIAAYPGLGVSGERPEVSSDWGIHSYLFNVEESTFETLEGILTEVMALFPGRYIHVGGDEAVKQQWVESEAVQARMRELGIEDEAALQSWFVKRIERFLNAHGRRLIGWDEILEGGIAPQATVMSWRGIDGALEAASLGHDTVLTPWPTLYFDHRQGALASEPPGRGRVITLEDVYRFQPMPEALAPDERHHVLGIQANLWSEHIRTEERLAYMAFPRAAALAEVAWSPSDRIDWRSFLERLPEQFERYRALGVPFATSAFDIRAAARVRGPGAIEVKLSNQAGAGTIRYTTDGSPVSRESASYADPLLLSAGVELSAQAFMDGRAVSRELRGSAGRLAYRRSSRELDLCTEKVVLSLEDDAPLDGPRSVFLVDILNPCWLWRGADLTGVTTITAAVGQVPFNFQFGGNPPQVELGAPQTAAGELEVRAGGCAGEVVAVLPLAGATESHEVSILSRDLTGAPDGRTDLCFRFRADEFDPLWVIDWAGLAHDPVVAGEVHARGEPPDRDCTQPMRSCSARGAGGARR